VTTPPRLFGIPALRAPVVAVVRRGPSDWSHLGRWDVAAGAYEPGAWIHANLYPQRCDVSPDGRWFAYFTLRPSARWEVGPTYLAVSRLPWLTALAAWPTCGTWSQGAHFVEDPGVWQVGEPAHGDAAPLRRRLGLALNAPALFAVERRRGWGEAPGSPPKRADDMWDLRRADTLTLEKPRPGSAGRTRLTVQGLYAAFRSGAPGEVLYGVASDAGERPLEDAQWADWDARGRLLVATTSGRLQIRSGPEPGDAVESEIDLAALAPAPAAPPSRAAEW
jgi:hypothetical protein